MNNPVSLSIDRGLSWWTAGFSLFTRSALTWIGITLLLFVIYIVLGFIPIIGGIVSQVLGPVFLAGLMAGCRDLKQGHDLSVNHLFAGFSRNTGQLMALGALYLVAMLALAIILAILVLLIPGGREVLENLRTGEPELIRSSLQFFMVLFLIGMALYIPVLMAYWFAPALVILGNMPVTDALASSFRACLFNILPFTLYGLVGLVLCVIAAIPFGLGFIILTPVVIATIYAAFDEIFAEREQSA